MLPPQAVDHIGSGQDAACRYILLTQGKDLQEGAGFRVHVLPSLFLLRVAVDAAGVGRFHDLASAVATG